MELQPCPGCRRHVAEAACPFCGAAVERGERGALFGRLSRAAVFASATLIACGGGNKQARDPDDEAQMPPKKKMPERHHPCSHGDPDKIAELENKKAEAKTDEERAEIDQQLAKERMPVCAPYGAPPARRRVV